MNEKKINLILCPKTPIIIGCLFLSAYSLGQYIIALLDSAPPSYHFYTDENAYRVVFISLMILISGLLQKKELIRCEFFIKQRRVIFLLAILAPITLSLCYFYPWGVYGQELTVGHSVKSIFRHAYFVLSLIALIGNPRLAIILIPIDVIMLILDPSRVFFIESFYPKIYFLYVIANWISKLKIFGFTAAALLMLLLIQSTRLGGIQPDFINFAIYSDIVHATYPALQLSQFSLDYPWKPLFDIESFQDKYGEALAPLGGFFVPGTFFISGELWLDCIIALIFSYSLFYFFLNTMKGGLNILALSGIAFLFQKFSIINTVKLIIAITFFTWLYRLIGLINVKIYKSNNI